MCKIAINKLRLRIDYYSNKKYIDLQFVPTESDYILPKDKFQLGPEFEETTLGYSEDSIAQYRRPNGQHILEYLDHYKGHRDHANPEGDPISHLVNDAPELLVSGIVGIFLTIYFIMKYIKYREKKESEEKEYSDNFWNNVLTVILIAIIIICIVGLVYYFVKGFREAGRGLLVVG